MPHYTYYAFATPLITTLLAIAIEILLPPPLDIADTVTLATQY